MTEEVDWLAALGRVEPPSPDALDAAREALWSAVAGEMLGTDPAGDRPRRRGSRHLGSRHRGSRRDPGS